MTTKHYLLTAGNILKEIRPLAVKYHSLTRRPLGVTGEIAEYEAIRLLKLQVCVARHPGHDAIRIVNGRKQKMQIKGRVLQSSSKGGGQLGSIKKDAKWDFVLLVLLDDNLNPVKIYQASKRRIINALVEPGSIARNERGQLSIAKFKSIAKLVWPK